MLSAKIKYNALTQQETTGDFTSQFISAMEMSGRMVSCRIYGLVSGIETLMFTDLNVNTINFDNECALLKSLMNSVEIELNGLYVLNDQVFTKVRIGVSSDFGLNYYYVDYGKFTVTESLQNLENKTTRITAYDEMLSAMESYQLSIDYEANTIYNITFFDAIASRIGLSRGNSIPTTGIMAIQRKQETYTAEYTYRDVLDDFAEILGGCIVVKNGALELLVPTDTQTTIDETQLSTIKLNKEFETVTGLVLSRAPQEDNVVRYTYDNSDPPERVPGETIRIENNQIVEGYTVNDVPDRTVYLDGILDRLNDWGSYWTLEFDSFGYCLYEPCDIITVTIANDGDTISVPCIWLSNKIVVGPGLTEHMESHAPEAGETDFTKSTSERIRELETYLIVDKVEGTINSLTKRVKDLEDYNRETVQTWITQTPEQIELGASTVVSRETSGMQDDIEANAEEIQKLINRVRITSTDTRFVGANPDTNYVLVNDSQVALVYEGTTKVSITADGCTADSYNTGHWVIQEMNNGNTWCLFKKNG